jgi:hypothetical protein
MNEKLLIELGRETYEMLEESQKRTLKLFIWAGCGCHKELNTVRSGYTFMSTTVYAELGIEGPVLLANKDNKNILKDITNISRQNPSRITPAQEKALEKTSRGAVKAAALAGSIFNNKDEKKGYHDIFRTWWKENVGATITFPDTSNTHFQSYCDAAAFMTIHGDNIKKFLLFAKNSKSVVRFSNMEENLYKALQCPYTQLEFAVLVLYAQAVTHPYMCTIRSPTNPPNMLTLGPFHQKVKDHVQKIIDQPDLLIGNSVTHTTGALDGKLWHNPEAVEIILKKKTEFPYLKELLVAFFKGASDGWSRFTSEFAPGGIIEESTVEEKDLAYLPATNDVNEGALGSFRVFIRHQPQLTPLHFNALAMFNRNNTGAFMKSKLTPLDKKFMRS